MDKLRCFESIRPSFHSYKPFAFNFWVLGELQSAKFVLRVVFLWSSLLIWNQNSSKFPAAFLELTNSDVTSFIPDNFPTAFQYLRNALFNSFETSKYVQVKLNEPIGLKWKKLIFGSFDS